MGLLRIGCAGSKMSVARHPAQVMLVTILLCISWQYYLKKVLVISNFSYTKEVSKVDKWCCCTLTLWRALMTIVSDRCINEKAFRLTVVRGIGACLKACHSYPRAQHRAGQNQLRGCLHGQGPPRTGLADLLRHLHHSNINPVVAALG